MIPGIRPIRAFLAVARLGSFTKAAAELHVSQPALTVQIHQLEESLSVRLFDRNKRQVALSSSGRELLRPLEKILADIEALMVASHDLSGLQTGSVAVATLPSVASSLLPGVIRQFATEHPNISIQINDAIADQVVRLVKTEEVDFGIGTKVGSDKEIDYVEFLSDELCAFFPNDHPLANRKLLKLRDVAAYPLILTTKGTSVRTLVERALEKERLEVTLACDANYMSTAVGMVRAGLGVSILPKSAIDSASCDGVQISVIRTPGLTRKIGLIRKRNRSLSPAAKCFIDLLREKANAPGENFAHINY